MARDLNTGFESAHALVLFSAGLDSTINLYQANSIWPKKVAAVTFDYGQRAVRREIAFASETCNKLGVAHSTIDLKWLGSLGGSSLTNYAQTVPGRESVRIDDLESSKKTAQAVWVPNRNGVFLNVAAAIAEAYGIPRLIPGFNLEEATTFPDNSEAFLGALNQVFKYSTNGKVNVECFTVRLDKKQIVEMGNDLGVDYSLVWPCYHGGEKPCGACESCQRFNRATGRLN